MSRAVVIVRHKADRELLKKWADGVPVGTRTEWKAPKRSIPQNDRMWSMLTEVSNQITYKGVKLTPDDLKLVFLDALKHEVRLVPNLEGTGFVNLGCSSSDLTKDEMSNLIELIFKYGAEHGVIFRGEK